MKDIITIDDVLGWEPCSDGRYQLLLSGIRSCHLSYLSRLPLPGRYIRWAMICVARCLDEVKLHNDLCDAWRGAQKSFFERNRCLFDGSVIYGEKHSDWIGEYVSGKTFEVWDAWCRERYEGKQ